MLCAVRWGPHTCMVVPARRACVSDKEREQAPVAFVSAQAVSHPPLSRPWLWRCRVTCAPTCAHVPCMLTCTCGGQEAQYVPTGRELRAETSYSPRSAPFSLSLHPSRSLALSLSPPSSASGELLPSARVLSATLQLLSRLALAQRSL
eukprot:3202993-Rhodomonas_salina.1